MRIELTSIFVDDQDEARTFYTEVLGFEIRRDIPLGDGSYWLTLVSPERPEGPELLLEPGGHPAVGPYRTALIADGIPLAQLAVDDVHAEVERLRARGVTITQEPMDIGPAIFAVFDDTCGNIIQLLETKPEGESSEVTMPVETTPVEAGLGEAGLGEADLDEAGLDETKPDAQA